MSFTRHLHRSRLGTSLSSYAYARRMISSSTREFKVILDNETLYVPQPVAEALGWNPVSDAQTGSVPLILHGWNPQYFSITQAGTESGESRPASTTSGELTNGL